MTKTYYLTTTGVSIDAATYFYEKLMSTSSSTGQEGTGLTSDPFWYAAWGAPSSEPGVATWPSADLSAYVFIINFTVMGASVSLADTGDAESLLVRFVSDLSSTRGACTLSGTWDTTTGTGLHTWTASSGDPNPGGAATDRAGFYLRMSTSSTMKDNIVNYSVSASTYLQGPWTAAATSLPPIPARFHLIRR